MSTISLERSIWVGSNVATIAYGVDIYMVFHSWYLLNRSKAQTPRKKAVFIGFGLVQLLLLTLMVATNNLTEQFMWIDHRDFPGGPVAYWNATSSDWFSVLNIACGVLSLAFSDVLLLYRCHIIWNATWRIMSIPILLFIAEIVMGAFFIVETIVPNAPFFLERAPFSIPWISIATALNIILTGLLVGKILYVCYRAKVSSDYTGIVAILVESAIPVALGGLAFVICNATGSIAAVSLSAIMGALNVLCPQAIILRVAMGRAWTDHTSSEILSKIEFSDKKPHSSHETGGTAQERSWSTSSDV